MFSAVFSSGVMIPVGFEFGFRTRLNVVHTRQEHWEWPLFDLSDYITAVNRMRAGIPVLNEEGSQRKVHVGDSALLCLLRRAQAGSAWVLSVLNTDLYHTHDAYISGLDPDMAEAREVTPGSKGEVITAGAVLRLSPGEARIFVNT
jgi:starch synthase (maltosyl-transferring)